MEHGGKRPGAGRRKARGEELYKRVSVTLTPGALKKLNKFAEEHGLSRSAAVEKLINTHKGD